MSSRRRRSYNTLVQVNEKFDRNWFPPRQICVNFYRLDFYRRCLRAPVIIDIRVNDSINDIFMSLIIQEGADAPVDSRWYQERACARHFSTG